MIILIDMDNTLADFEKAFLAAWCKKYPDELHIPLEERRSFHVTDDYPEDLGDKIRDICHSKGFVFNLPPAIGGVDAVNTMLQQGHDVRFCTSHFTEYDPSVLEKFQWVDKHFGKTFVDKIVLTRDKTLVKGDILIDDKPIITGIATPTWEHILYDQPYNRTIVGQRRLTWDNWQAIISI
jgi:5'-nucleotidase